MASPFITRFPSPVALISLVAAIASLLLTGCAQMPTGPTVAVMPGPNKPFDVFMQDDQICRGWAAHSIGIPGNDAAAERFLASTAVGTAIGALAGAAAGGHRGPETGAAAGMVMGAAVGANQSAGEAWSGQRRYDIAYQQCMYSQGNMVPIYGNRHAPSLAAPPPPPPPVPR
jgi:uncharacterized protein YcfJ